MQTRTTNITLADMTRRTVRSWWADGLWDFVMAGFMALLGVWLFVLVRVVAFPTWSWPWPFITSEVINPMQTQLILWMMAIVPVAGGYSLAAFKIVQMLKSRWLASRQGDVQHSFWLKVEPQTYAIFLITYLAYVVVAAALFNGLAGGPRWMSAVIIAAPASVLVIFGIVYSLPRYWMAGALGGLTALGLELLATTPADYMTGPVGFFDVSTEIGNPAIPALVWVIVFLISGVIGLAGVLSKPVDEDLI